MSWLPPHPSEMWQDIHSSDNRRMAMEKVVRTMRKRIILMTCVKNILKQPTESYSVQQLLTQYSTIQTLNAWLRWSFILVFWFKCTHHEHPIIPACLLKTGTHHKYHYLEDIVQKQMLHFQSWTWTITFSSNENSPYEETRNRTRHNTEPHIPHCINP
jgi:hypothetical protein